MSITKAVQRRYVALIYDDANGIFRPGDDGFFTEDDVNQIIEHLNRTLDFYNENKEMVIVENEKVYQNHIEKQKPFVKTKNVSKRSDLITNVYIMIDNHTGHYKIGRSDNPVNRESTLLSQKSSIELLFHAQAPFRYEKALHSLFAEKRIRGEWFDLTISDVELIKNLLS